MKPTDDQITDLATTIVAEMIAMTSVPTIGTEDMNDQAEFLIREWIEGCNG